MDVAILVAKVVLIGLFAWFILTNAHMVVNIAAKVGWSERK